MPSSTLDFTSAELIFLRQFLGDAGLNLIIVAGRCRGLATSVALNNPTASIEPTIFIKPCFFVATAVFKVTSDPIDETLRFNCLVNSFDARVRGEDALVGGRTVRNSRRNFLRLSGLD